MSRSRPITSKVLAVLTLSLLLVSVGAVRAEYLGNVRFDQQPNGILPSFVQVNVTIDYKIDDPAGRRIYAMPYTDGAPTPHLNATTSGLYPPGTGTVTRFFTVALGSVVVDEVRVYMSDAGNSELIMEMFVPASFRFGPHGVYNIVPNHSQYSHLRHGMSLSMTFDYEVDAANCRIRARPWNGSHVEPGYSASGSSILPPAGSYSQQFSFSQDADISHIRFQIWTGDNATLLEEIFVPWDCHWREWGVYDFSFNHDTMTSLHHSQQIVAEFTVDHVDPDGCAVWIRTCANGYEPPDGMSQPSPYEPMVPHTVTRWASVISGPTHIDHVLVQVGIFSEYFYEFQIPMVLDFGPHAIQNFEFTPAAPAIMSHDERLEMAYDYLTDHGDGVRIFGRAAYGTTPLFGQTNPGVPVYPAPFGSGSFWMSYSEDRTATAIRFEMFTPDYDEVLFEWFEQGGWIWADSGTITDVEPIIPVATAELGPCYPNPFNPTTTIPVLLTEETHVRLSVFDLRGRLVRTLKDGTMPAGNHALTLRGDGLSSDAYICRLETRHGVQTQRITLLK